LDLLDGIEQAIPTPGPSPIQIVEFEGRQRRRATGRRSQASADTAEPQKPWVWGDEQP
jgi:hypothetical protein